ncbi:MAG: UDP-3-O-(3-hydroxymyristoyl)glucosamine N-acyltransferase [Planctomycetota bacterium]
MITRTASEIAEICGATLEGDGSIQLVGPASLKAAEPNHVSFLGNPQYRGELEGTRAGAVVLAPDVEVARADLALLRCDNPNAAFSQVIAAFHGAEADLAPGVHPAAWVDPTAELGEDVAVGPNATVGAGARIGARTALHAGVTVGAGSELGADCVLHSGVVLYPRTKTGDRCILHGGVVLGSDGFGFEPTAKGWVKIPQCGWVELGHDVEIGANSAVDCGRFEATRIESGVKIDNLCHIAHNVRIGAGSLLIAQVGISGSTELGRGVIFAGRAAAAGHLTIGDGARIAGKSGVTKDVPAGATYAGYPAGPRGPEMRVQAAQRRVPELLRTVRELEERIARLEGGNGAAR